MRALPALVLYLVGALLGGALLAPWLYWLLVAGAASIPALQPWADQPFHRFVNRCALGLAVAGLYPLLRHLRVRHWREVGLVWPRAKWRDAAAGFALGVISLAVAVFAAWMTGASHLEIQRPPGALLLGASRAMVSAVLVALIEELLFRGAFFGLMRREHSWILAMVVSTLVYALVHFFQRPPLPESVHWWTGLETLGLMLRGFTAWDWMLPKLLVLLLAGAILALAYERAGTLYLPIGLHAGWVFWMKCYSMVSIPSGSVRLEAISSQQLLAHWSTLATLLPVAGIVWMRPQHDRREVP